MAKTAGSRVLSCRPRGRAAEVVGEVGAKADLDAGIGMREGVAEGAAPVADDVEAVTDVMAAG